MRKTVANQVKNLCRYARYAETPPYASGWQTFSYGKLGELNENIRTFALPFENQTYTFAMQYEYDPFNRIQSMLYPDSERVEYGYNLGGMLTKVTGTVTRKTSDLVVPVLLQGGGLLQGGDGVQGLGPGGDHAVENTMTIRYPYLDSIVYNQFELKDSVIYGNGTRVRYVYDSLQRLAALRSYTADDELMQDIAYHYDSAGNISDIENSAEVLANGLGGTYRQEYTYDNLYRLTNATGWWECRSTHLTLRDTVDMSYSKNGRIIRKRTSAETLKNMQLNLVRYDRQYQYPSDYSNKVDRVTNAMSGASHLFAWDGSGNMAHHDDPDQNCDRHLSWTEDNRLQFVKDNGSTGAYYQYDAGGDRTYKLLYHKTTGSLNGVQTDYYTLDDATLYVSPYLVVTPQGYTKHYYAESERITTQLGKYRFAVVDSCVAGDSLAPIKLQNATQAFPTDSFPTPAPMLGYLHSLTNHPNTASSLYFYHPDHLGSASWITNIYGRTIQHLYYLPWGEDFVNQRTSSFSSMYTFSAKEKDAETGYSYFGSRYYSSDLSVWLSVDPMADKYPHQSNYVYCSNNPIVLIDPNGTKDRPFNAQCDKTVCIIPGTATPICKTKGFGVIWFYSKQSRENAYNCHSYAWHNSQGDPTPQKGDLPKKPVFGATLNRWDNNPADDIKEQNAIQLGRDEDNKPGDIVIYYTDANANGQYDDGEFISHSAVVKTVDDEGYTQTVIGKMGEDGISENHPDAPGYYQKVSNPVTKKDEEQSRAYFRRQQQSEQTK